MAGNIPTIISSENPSDPLLFSRFPGTKLRRSQAITKKRGLPSLSFGCNRTIHIQTVLIIRRAPSASGPRLKRVSKRYKACSDVVPVTGPDCRSRKAGTYRSHRFLNWWQQMGLRPFL